MWKDKALSYGADILLSAYAVYLFFYYFDIFFARKKSKKLWVIGLTEFILWQFGISTIISLPAYVNIAVTVIVTLFAVTEYSCAVTPQVRQTGNRLSGLAGTAYASLLT